MEGRPAVIGPIGMPNSHESKVPGTLLHEIS
jgi:hypothetical protein